MNTKMLRHQGVTIAAIKVTRYEVRTPDGRKVKTFTTLPSARAFVDGYVKALDRYAPKEPKQ